MKVKSFSCVRLLATPWTAAHQAPPIHAIFQARVLEWGAIAFSDIVYKLQHFSNESPDLRGTMLEMYW